MNQEYKYAYKRIYSSFLVRLCAMAKPVLSISIISIESAVKSLTASKRVCRWQSSSGQAIYGGAGRGAVWTKPGADHIGMLATTINCLAMQDAFVSLGGKADVFTAVEMQQFARIYTRDDAVSALEAGKIAIFACGLGNPYFSTDTAAVLRAVEIGADISLFAKNIDGVYSADPKKEPTAVKYDTLTYEEILAKRLGAIDLTAAAFCLDNNMPILVFGLDEPENISRAVKGEKIGTILSGGR